LARVPPVHVVILNWNGAPDTVACLDSLSGQKGVDLRLIVVDNGSTDDSVPRISGWAAEHPACQVELIQSGTNLGFAVGSNAGIKRALEAGAEFILVLNNDTLLAPDAIAHLARFLVDHADYVGVTPQIRYAGRPVVWNCGGDLTWSGSRKYLYGEEPIEAVPRSGWRRITFITGCAALFRASMFREHGLYTERFFFGEEDYELSRRLHRLHLPLACCFDSVIEHKVGSSIDRAAPPAMLGRYYLYYLNRFIDMRDYYPTAWWWLWRLGSLAVVAPKLRARHLSWRAMWVLFRRLLRDSSRLDGVSKERFEAATRSGPESI
jgi:GT2 family glycosyltransferase